MLKYSVTIRKIYGQTRQQRCPWQPWWKFTPLASDWQLTANAGLDPFPINTVMQYTPYYCTVVCVRVCVCVLECVRQREGRHYCEYYYLTLITQSRGEWSERIYGVGDGGTERERGGKKGRVKELGHMDPISIVPVINTWNTLTPPSQILLRLNERGTIGWKDLFLQYWVIWQQLHMNTFLNVSHCELFAELLPADGGWPPC